MMECEFEGCKNEQGPCVSENLFSQNRVENACYYCLKHLCLDHLIKNSLLDMDGDYVGDAYLCKECAEKTYKRQNMCDMILNVGIVGFISAMVFIAYIN